MKELSIEEKAKAYDRVIENAYEFIHSNLNATDKDKYTISVLETLVLPELAESEDERIRKALIEMVKMVDKNPIHQLFGYGDITYSDMISWLEKQSTPQVRTGLEWVNTIDDACDKRYLEEYAHGEYCHEQSFKWGFQEGVDWLEKQGEQKAADKVEPKFHKGEWIVHHGTENIYQVVAVIDNQYQLKYGDTYTVQKCSDVDRCARLWDIAKDAKDGDVLHSPSHRLIWIYKDNEHYHACVNMNYVTENTATNNQIVIPNDACPATKDEQTILFANMEEAGYMWDADKRVLKKIEQKPAENKGMNLVEEDMTPFQKKVFCIIDTAIEEEQGLKQVCEELLRLAHDEIMQKPAWSEEDEKKRTLLISILKVNHPNGYFKVNPANTLNMEAMHTEELVNWLKSLGPQNRWEPSDEQMDALHYVTNFDYGGHKATLVSLYEQLKKLREE